LNWALRVDAIAGEAESAFRSGDVLVAIERYRDALQESARMRRLSDEHGKPVMRSLARCGMPCAILSVLPRSARQNARIARNLVGARGRVK